VKNPEPQHVYHDSIGSRLRQKVSTSSSSSSPAFVSRGKPAASSKVFTAVDSNKAANTAASSSKFMASLLKKSSKRSDMLSRIGQIRTGGPGEDLSDTDEDEPDGAGPATNGKFILNGRTHKGRPLPDATALDSSDDSESSDEDDVAGLAGAAVPDGLGALGSAADDISAVLAKDRLAKEARKVARREHRRKTWTGCWVRTKKQRREKPEKLAETVEFVKEPVRTGSPAVSADACADVNLLSPSGTSSVSLARATTRSSRCSSPLQTTTTPSASRPTSRSARYRPRSSRQ
jgi:hypothetical protein